MASISKPKRDFWRDGNRFVIINRLKQVLVNLIVNAIKYTDTGCIAVNVSEMDTSCPSFREKQPCAEDENRLDILFEVNDTGIGIEKERDLELSARCCV